jgi:hypothetical protein
LQREEKVEKETNGGVFSRQPRGSFPMFAEYAIEGIPDRSQVEVVAVKYIY